MRITMPVNVARNYKSRTMILNDPREWNANVSPANASIGNFFLCDHHEIYYTNADNVNIFQEICITSTWTISHYS